MGLLSRFGRGLTQAAPIMGQMAQASLLQAAEDKKYNRLVEREELKHTRGVESAELAYTRGVSAAQRKERLTFIDTGLTLNDNRIKMETDLIGRLTINESSAINPMNKELIRGEIEDARKRLADALATKNRLTALYQSYVDPEGKLGVFSKEEEDRILTDVAVMNAASIGKDEILGADADALNVSGAEGISTEEFDIDTDIFTDVQRAARRENKDVLIEEQLKALDEAVSGRAEPLNDKQKKLFRDTMESYVQDRKHLSDPDISARRVAAEERTDKEIASVLERRPEAAGVSAEEGDFFPEDPSVTISGAGADAEAAMYNRWGQKVFTTVGKLTKQLYDLLSSVNIEEELKDSLARSEMKSKLLEALNRQATDATISEILGASEEDALSALKGVGGVPTRTSTVLGAMIWLLNSGWDIGEVIEAIKVKGNKVSSNTPSVEDAIAMMFDMPQRV